MFAPEARAQAEPARTVSGTYAELAACAATSLGKLYPSRVGALKRPGERQERVDLIVSEPRSGVLGSVYRGSVRRLTLSVEKAGERAARVELRPGDAPLGGEEIARIGARSRPAPKAGRVRAGPKGGRNPPSVVLSSLEPTRPDPVVLLRAASEPCPGLNEEGAAMIDARKLLDALVGGGSQGGAQGSRSLDEVSRLIGQALESVRQTGFANTAQQVFGQAAGGLSDAARQLNQSTGSVGAGVDQAVARAAGVQSTDELAKKAKDFLGQNPGATSAAAAGLAGLLLTSRQGRGIAGNLAGLGGIALIGGLAYKAFQNYQAGRPLLDTGAPDQANAPPQPAAVAPPPAPLPQPPSFNAAAFDPAVATDDDAILYLRAMVAAAAADGQVSPDERARIVDAVGRAGLSADAARWLEGEIAAPLTVDDIADRVQTPEKAAQVYAAARIAIEPDTLQEREFLRQLAQALDLDPGLRAHIDDTASGIKVAGA